MHLAAAARRRLFYAVVTVAAISVLGLASRTAEQNRSQSAEAAQGLSAAAGTEQVEAGASAAKAQAPASQTTRPAPTEVEAEPKPKYVEYIVAEGDTVEAIASRYGLKVNTVLWANEIGSEDILSIGQELIIPAVDGLLRKVRSGDTLWDIALESNAYIDEIVKANPDVDPNMISPGTVLMIPGGEPVVRRVVASRGGTRTMVRTFAYWPASGPLTDPFGWRVHPVYSSRHFHDGMDIGVSPGTPVKAAAGGTVSLAGWYGGYGIVVRLDHAGGVQTMYAHLSRASVSNGQQVEAGQLIGYSGNTGVSTGPHLHFSVFVNGNPSDPRPWLP